jgi:cysteate synthase
MLCQNSAFSPVRAAWRSGRAPVPSAAGEDRLVIEGTYAVELTNRRPPYAVRGGLRDCLTDSRGDVLVADSASARDAAEMFHRLEGIDIEPAAGVALACLREAVAGGEIPKSATILLNVTGGGRARREREHELLTPEPDLRVDRSDLGSAHAMDAVGKLIGTLAGA